MKFRKIMRARVEIGRHAIVGAGSIIFPGVMLAEGSSDWLVQHGYKVDGTVGRIFRHSSKKDKKQTSNLLELEKEYLAEQQINLNNSGTD